MPQKNKIKQFPAVLSGILFLSAGILRMLVPPEASLGTIAFVYSNIIYLGIIFSWGIYIERSVLSVKIRRLILAVVFFIVMYVLFGAA